MRAVVIATMDRLGITSLEERHPHLLLPLVDRPFVQHLVEYFAGQGIREFDFVLTRIPGSLDSFLGDGTRWGSTFRYHLATEPSSPYRALSSINLGGHVASPILLGHADRLPPILLHEALSGSESFPILFSWHNPSTSGSDNPRRWTGWALLDPTDLATVPSGADESGLKAHLLSRRHHGAAWRDVGRSLRMHSCHDVLASHRAVLAKEFPGLFLSGRETGPGVWLARGSTLHPTVHISPPVYVGENCMVGREVRLGPHAVLVRDCILDDYCSVRNSIILPGSYAGKGLQLTDTIVDGQHLIDARLGRAVTVTDEFILGSLSASNLLQRLTGLFSRVGGLVHRAFPGRHRPFASLRTNPNEIER